MRKFFLLLMTTFLSENVLEKQSKISIYKTINSIDEDYKKEKPYLESDTSKLVENTKA